ncbi:unnamed protein product [Lampetra planeri]
MKAGTAHEGLQGPHPGDTAMMLGPALLRVARCAVWRHRVARVPCRGEPSVVAFRQYFTNSDAGNKDPRDARGNTVSDARTKDPRKDSGNRREDVNGKERVVDLDLWKSIASKSIPREASADDAATHGVAASADNREEAPREPGAPSIAERAEAPQEPSALSTGEREEAAREPGAPSTDERANSVGEPAAPESAPELADGHGGLSAAVELAGVGSAEATLQLIGLWREAGKSVPSVMTDAQIQEYLEMTSKSMRQRFLRFLHKRECMKDARKQKQEAKREERKLLPPKEEAPELPLRNSFLLTFWARSEERAFDWRLAQAMQHGQPLVIDMSYDDMMNSRASRSCAEQIIELMSSNRRALDPFHLHLCGYAPGDASGRTASAALARLYGADALRRILVTETERSYLELFPHERLVYLTADSPNVLREFDPSAVYVVGGFVDLSIETGVSLGRAKRQGLATARLPLEKYLSWGLGGKNLTLDQVVKILDRVKDTGDWSDALRFVPRRKLKNTTDADFAAGRHGHQHGQYGQQGQYGRHGQQGRPFDNQRAFRPGSDAGVRRGPGGQRAGNWGQGGEARGGSAGDTGRDGGGRSGARREAWRWQGDDSNGYEWHGAKGHGTKGHGPKDGFLSTWQSKSPDKR